VTGPALLLTPSRGSGGGIERFASTVEWAFGAEGVEYDRIDLHGSGPAAHARLLSQARAALRAGHRQARVVIAHRTLLPAATVLTANPACRGVSLICHGIDVWGSQSALRRHAERRLMSRCPVRLVAVSNFTAGSLLATAQATVLPPGLSRPWFDTLVGASSAARPAEPGLHLVTAFRLADWRNKGLPELLGAVAGLGRPDVRLTVCGSGEPPLELRRMVGQHPWCTLRPRLGDGELARHLAAADLFVLATRTRYGRRACGEGFGMVLLEAQVAGTAVVAPAHGGSHEAFVEAVTGVAPTDETEGSLMQVLGRLLDDPAQLEQMGKRAAEWARECFAPDIYAPLAVSRLL
jgi:phosphatidylinositol alpha-1,6-mannosyltransferase